MSETLSADQVNAKYRSLLPDTSGDLYVSLYHSVATLNVNWRFYRELFGTSTERVSLLNESAAAVFQSYQQALRVDVFLAICRLTDPPMSSGKANASLAQLIGTVRAHLKDHQAQMIDHELKALQDLAHPIRVRRNKVLAHHDLGHATFTAEPLPGVTSEFVTDVIARTSDLLNRIGAFFDAGNVMYADTIEGPGGTVALIRRLEIARDMRQEYFARRRGAT